MTTQEFTPDYIVIQLTKGQSTWISPEDADLANIKWQANGGSDRSRYACRQNPEHKSQKEYLHRVILERLLSRPLLKGEVVDHINMNKLDNRRENLRVATRSQNQENRGMPRNNKSGYKGVSWVKKDKKWTARIKHNKEAYSLGFFKTPEEAYQAYCDKARELHGEFANLG